MQFSKADYQAKGLGKAILEEIQQNAEELGILLKKDTVKSAFYELIQKAALQSAAGKVVLLIDEYDKPIIDNLDDIPQANENRDIL